MDRPILMSAPMVRACLREVDPKTQTRRVIKPQPRSASGCYRRPDGLWIWINAERPDNGPGPGVGISEPFRCPHGAPGDRLWVRETTIKTPAGIAYAADGGDHYGAGGKLRKTPAIHMPRWASRLTLQIAEVRVERLQDISEADAWAEGLEVLAPPSRDGMRHLGIASLNIDEPTASRAYRALWEHINGPGSWAANPWVWVVVFARERA